MRSQKIVKTMDTSKEVTSIEIIEQGQHITTADGNEVPQCFEPHAHISNGVMRVTHLSQS